MRIEAICRVVPTIDRANEYAERDVLDTLVSKWIKGYPNSSLILRRPQKLIKDTDDTKYHYTTIQGTALVLPIPQAPEVTLVSIADIQRLCDEFYSKHRMWPNTIMIPPGTRFAQSGEWLRGGRSMLMLEPSNEPVTIYEQFTIVENAPRLAVALL